MFKKSLSFLMVQGSSRFEDCLHVEGLIYFPCFMPKILLHNRSGVKSLVRWPLLQLLNKRLKKTWVLNCPNSGLKKFLNCVHCRNHVNGIFYILRAYSSDSLTLGG